MATALDLIKSSLRLIRVIDAAETPSAADADTALFTLNALLGQWSAQPNTIYQSAEISLVLTPGDGEYTVGTTGDITTAITKIEEAYIRDLSGTDIPLIIYSESEYQSIPNKDDAGTPIAINYERQDKVRLWPVPNQAETLRIIALSPFSSVTLNTDIVYPVEYTDALRFALSRRLAPEYGFAWSGELEAQYQECMGIVKAMNLSQTMSPATFDLPSKQNSNIWFRRVNFPS